MDVEVVVTDGSPRGVVENLHAALVVLPLVSRQAELDPGRVRRQLGGGVLLLFWVWETRRVAEVFVLGESQPEEHQENDGAAGPTPGGRHVDRN